MPVAADDACFWIRRDPATVIVQAPDGATQPDNVGTAVGLGGEYWTLRPKNAGVVERSAWASEQFWRIWNVLSLAVHCGAPQHRDPWWLS